MLSPPELEIVRRDTAIPGLATVLDTEAFLTELQPFLTEVPLIAAHPRYIRYKPGMSCLVAYRLEAAGVFHDVYAKAHGPDASVKLENAFVKRIVPGALGPGRIALENCAVVVSFFPNDSKLKRLCRLSRPDVRTSLFSKFVPDAEYALASKLETLRYKPERRYVARLLTPTDTELLLKFYTEAGFLRSQVSTTAFDSHGTLRIPRCLGESERYWMLGFEWLPGQVLTEIIDDDAQALEAVEETGAALAEFHAQVPQGLLFRTRYLEAARLTEGADWIGFVLPSVAESAKRLAERLAAWIITQPPPDRPIHGDFYASQVLWSKGRVGVIDLDSAAMGDRRTDLALFAAHLERDALQGKVMASSLPVLQNTFFEGYKQAGGGLEESETQPYIALELFGLAHGPFRACEPDWKAVTEAIVDRAEALVSESLPAKSRFPMHSDTSREGGARLPIEDPFQAGQDPKMSFLVRALDPGKAETCLEEMFRSNNGGTGRTQLEGIRVMRHKPGRRCLVEYTLTRADCNGHGESMTLLGKARARKLDRRTFRLCETLWTSGFATGSPDGISIPQPMGNIPEFQMWFQRKVNGTPATLLLQGNGGIALAIRIAAAIHKVHQMNIPPHRRHFMKDELHTLRECLCVVADENPQWISRLERVLNDCARLGATVPETEPTGIHRDFYPDHVLVSRNRLYLVDFDLFAYGDRGVDIGNFIGHLAEHSLRTLGHIDALGEQEAALEEEYLKLSGEQFRRSIRVYKTLTLARHIYISTRIQERRAFTEPLLEACERNLGLVEQSRVIKGSSTLGGSDPRFSTSGNKRRTTHNLFLNRRSG